MPSSPPCAFYMLAYMRDFANRTNAHTSQANENEVRGKYPKLRQSVKDMMYAPFQSAFHHRNMVERM